MPTLPTSSLTLTKILECEPDYAFRAWTTPELFKQWFVPKPGVRVNAAMDVRVGGKYRLSFEKPEPQPSCYVTGEFLVVDPPRRLEYTWEWEDESRSPCVETTIVKIAFNELPNERTEVVLTHERFTDEDERTGHTEGWSSILNRMAESIAQQKRI